MPCFYRGTIAMPVAHRVVGGFTPMAFLKESHPTIVMPVRRLLSMPDRGSIWRIVLAIAREIEGSRQAGEDWMRHEGIAEFGGLTAADLIEAGQGGQVIGFLMDVLEGLRG